MNLVDRYDSIISIVALISAIAMMAGTGMSILALGIWAMKAAIGYGRKPRELDSGNEPMRRTSPMGRESDPPAS